MVCKNCGKELDEKFEFCTECGAKLEKIQDNVLQDKKFCSNCGAEVKSDAAFCVKCGYRFNNAPTQTPNPMGASAYNPNDEMLYRRNTTYNKQKSNLWIYILIAVIAAVMAAGALWLFMGGGMDMITGGNSDESRITKVEKTDEDDLDKPTEKTKKVKKTPKPTKTPEPTPEPMEDELLPTDSRYITERDLDGKNQEEVALIRNEIYARHGYIFKSEEYARYFGAKEWYVPNPDFSEADFSAVELWNKDFIVEYEKSKGWR